MTTPCVSLVSLKTMYQFDPNFGLNASFTPAAGSLAAAALAYKGVACRWTQQTSGETIDISVAHPSAAALATLRASAGAPVGASGRFFRTAGGVGTIQAFSGPYWIVASSTYFSSTADAAPLLDSATKALG